MAAETFEALSYKQVPACAKYPSGVTYRISKEENFTLDTAADKVKFFKLPRGAKLLGGCLIGGDHDSAATPATVTVHLKATDGTTTYTLISAAQIGTAAADVTTEHATYGLQTGWRGKVLNNESWYVYAEIGTPPTTAAAANLQAGIFYTLDTEPGELT